MNRNVESTFAEEPSAHIQRSRFDRSHSFKFTGNAGDLIPFLCEEVLPGDTFDITTSKVIRLQTLISPVMDNLYLDVFYFFVPNRLVWDHWKQFMGENTGNAWLPSVTYSIPQLTIDSTHYVAVNSVLDYLGIPPSKSNHRPALAFSALPVRAYNLIWDQWFRDQNYMQPINFYSGDSNVQVDMNDPVKGGICQKVSRFHDYFSSCLPAPQKAANPVTLNKLGIPVQASGTHPVDSSAPLLLSHPDYGPSAYAYSPGQATVTDTSSVNQTVFRSSLYSASSNGFYPVNLWTQNFTLFDINTLRLAFQTQKFLEKQAMGGSRYREVILSHFGVRSPDARQQIPEYLGGNRVPIQIQQVVNTSQSATSQLGNLGAMSNTTDIHSDVFKSFTEHGYLIGVCCLRYENSYAQGVEKHWFRHQVYDFYWPVFAHVGNQPVMTRELFMYAGSNTVWGYQEAWADYRYKPNRVAGEMRPYVPNGLSSWSFADDYDTSGGILVDPVLSQSWLYCDKTNLDRCLAVTSAVSNQFFADFFIDEKVTRPMPVFSIPGLADHF